MCRLYSFILLIVCILYPLSVLAEMPAPNLVSNGSDSYKLPSSGQQTDNYTYKQNNKDEENNVVVGRQKESNNINNVVVGRPKENNNYNYNNKKNNNNYNYNNKKNNNYHYNNYNHSHNSYYHNNGNVVYRPSTVHHVNMTRPYSQNISPYSQTTIWYTNIPAKRTIVDTDDSSYRYVRVYSDSVNSHKLGFGLSIPISFNSGFDVVESHVAGGLGFYITFRPIRYISLEFINNYLFGSLEYNNYYQEYNKVPLVFGLRYHFFDYGDIDLYLVASGLLSIWSFVDNNSNNNVYLVNKGYQFGGQFGAGLTYNVSIFSFGIDIRYTLETVPDFIPYLYMKHDDDKIHGCLLTFVIGISL